MLSSPSQKSLFAVYLLGPLVGLILFFLGCGMGLMLASSGKPSVRQALNTHTILQRLLSDIDDAETGQRGYLITKDPSYLEPYRKGVIGISSDRAQLEALLKDRPECMERYRTLSVYIDRKMQELAYTISLASTGTPEGMDASLRVVKSNAGKTYMDRIRGLISQLESDNIANVTKQDFTVTIHTGT